MTFRNIILIYKFLNKNYKIDVNEYFTLNKRNDRFILPLMKTTKYQNTVFFKGIKYYNDKIFASKVDNQLNVVYDYPLQALRSKPTI